MFVVRSYWSSLYTKDQIEANQKACGIPVKIPTKKEAYWHIPSIASGEAPVKFSWTDKVSDYGERLYLLELFHSGDLAQQLLPCHE